MNCQFCTREHCARIENRSPDANFAALQNCLNATMQRALAAESALAAMTAERDAERAIIGNLSRETLDRLRAERVTLAMILVILGAERDTAQEAAASASRLWAHSANEAGALRAALGRAGEALRPFAEQSESARLRRGVDPEYPPEPDAVEQAAIDVLSDPLVKAAME